MTMIQEFTTKPVITHKVDIPVEELFQKWQ